MSKFGIEIGVEGPGESLSAEAEAAVEKLLGELGELGLEIIFAAVLAPTGTQPLAGDAPTAGVAAVDPSALPAALVPPGEDAAWKCPGCGREFASYGICTGANDHEPIAVKPIADVAGDAEPAPASTTDVEHEPPVPPPA